MKNPSILYKATRAASHKWRLACRHIGLPFVYIGVGSLAIFYFTGLTNNNLLLVLPLLFVVAGIIGFVHQQKIKDVY